MRCAGCNTGELISRFEALDEREGTLIVNDVSESAVVNVIASSLRIEPSRVDDSLSYQSVPEWGSLQHVTLMLALAEQFGIGDSAADARELTSVPRIKERLGVDIRHEASALESTPDDVEMSRIDRGLTNTILDFTRITKVGSGSQGPRYRGHDSLELSNRQSVEAVAALMINGDLRRFGDSERALISGGRVAAGDCSVFFEAPAPNETTRFVRTLASVDISFASRGESDQYQRLRREGWALLGAAASLVSKDWSLPDLVSSQPIIETLLSNVDVRVSRELASETLSSILVLQADNGASASTLALRVAIGAGATLQEAISAATFTFSGSLHGGALKAIVEFLEERDVSQVRADVRRMVEAGDPVPGFGHRVYPMGDPRTAPMKKMFEGLVDATGEHEYGEKLREMRRIMASRETVGLAANYDLYAGPAWRLIGVEIEQLIPLFATARMIGWIAHAIEQRQSNMLIRPQLAYIDDQGSTN